MDRLTNGAVLALFVYLHRVFKRLPYPALFSARVARGYVERILRTHSQFAWACDNPEDIMVTLWREIVPAILDDRFHRDGIPIDRLAR